jgi:hypothetical protein
VAWWLIGVVATWHGGILVGLDVVVWRGVVAT